MLRWKNVVASIATVALAATIAGCGGAASTNEGGGAESDTVTEQVQTNDGESDAVSEEVQADASEDTKDSETSEERLFIIDTDTGADDVSAIVIAARHPHVRLLGVTTLAGNVTLEQSTKNALMGLELAGSDAPVYPGSEVTYEGVKREVSSIMGSDAMSGLDLIHPKRQAETSSGVDFILDSVAAHPNQVEILSIGPATNIALALDKDPETMGKVKRIWSMGTTGLGPGNATPVSEFNVYVDAPAYKRMLDSGIPITIMGLDAVSDEARLTREEFEKLEGFGGVAKFTALSFTVMRDFYKNNGSDRTPNYDGVAAMCALYPDFVLETETYHGECITDPGICYGQVVFFKEGFNYDFPVDDYVYNVELIRNVEGSSFYDALSHILRNQDVEPFGSQKP